MKIRHEFDASVAEAAQAELAGFSIDSRSVRPRELFFALSPEDYHRHNFTATDFADAHEFIPQALERGAEFVIARRERIETDEKLRVFKSRLLLVEDVIQALQDLAHGIITRWNKPVVAITGSAGKTTTKDLTARLLTSNNARVVSTQKNYNNELGVPLSILQMESNGNRATDFDIAVLEMGMSLPGEIKRLCEIARPSVAVELIVAPVHLQFFKSIEEIAIGKRALVEALAPEGTAILNADDERVIKMRDAHNGRTLTFGIASKADITADEVDASQLGSINFRLHTPRGSAKVKLPLSGKHNLSNALAASAIAHVFEMSPEAIAKNLNTSAPSQMRGEVVKFLIDKERTQGFTLIDDSYNSNPRSLRAMVEMLTEIEGKRNMRRLVVAGEMLELGNESAHIHFEAGREIAKIGKVDLLCGVRGQAKSLIEGARAAGMRADAARFVNSVEEATAQVFDEIRDGDVVLIKGSRGVGLDAAVRSLRERYATSE